MWQLPKGLLIAIMAALITVFGAIYLYFESLANQEAAFLRDDIFEVQRAIVENLLSDYDMGLGLIDDMMLQNEDVSQRIIYGVLDKALQDARAEDAFSVVAAFMKQEKGTLNVYDLNTGLLLHTFGSETFYVPQPGIGKSGAAVAKGTYQVVENPFHGVTAESALSRLYYYYPKSKPWLMVLSRREDQRTELKTTAEHLITDNMQQVQHYLNYELIIVSDTAVVSNASDSALKGYKLAEMTPYKVSGLLNDMTKAKTGSPLQRITLTDPDGKPHRYVGIYKDLGAERVLFASPEPLFDAEDGLDWRFAAFASSFLLALFCLHLLMRNYLYFSEGQSVGGDKL